MGITFIELIRLEMLYYPGEEIRAGRDIQPDARARVGRLFPCWCVGLVFVTFFHAGVICPPFHARHHATAR